VSSQKDPSSQPTTIVSNRDVQKIIDMHPLANQLPDHLSDLKVVTKSHVPACNASEMVEIPPKNGSMFDSYSKA
jgi:hypothetical protein